MKRYLYKLILSLLILLPLHQKEALLLASSAVFNCVKCDKKAKQACSACQGPRYCSRECQKQDWPQHKPSCQASQKLFQEYGTHFEAQQQKRAEHRRATSRKLLKITEKLPQGAQIEIWASGAGHDLSDELLRLWAEKECSIRILDKNPEVLSQLEMRLQTHGITKIEKKVTDLSFGVIPWIQSECSKQAQKITHQERPPEGLVRPVLYGELASFLKENNPPNIRLSFEDSSPPDLIICSLLLTALHEFVGNFLIHDVLKPIAMTLGTPEIQRLMRQIFQHANAAHFEELSQIIFPHDMIKPMTDAIASIGKQAQKRVLQALGRRMKTSSYLYMAATRYSREGYDYLEEKIGQFEAEIQKHKIVKEEESVWDFPLYPEEAAQLIVWAAIYHKTSEDP